MNRSLRRRRRRADTTATTRSIKRGDVAGVVPADLPPARRDLISDRADITRWIEELHRAGGIDVATGGHLVDRQITAWHDHDIAQQRTWYLERHAAAERLVGVAETVAAGARATLASHEQQHKQTVALADRALADMFGQIGQPSAEPPAAPHRTTCPAMTPSSLELPWLGISAGESA